MFIFQVAYFYKSSISKLVVNSQQYLTLQFFIIINYFSRRWADVWQVVVWQKCVAWTLPILTYYHVLIYHFEAIVNTTIVSSVLTWRNELFFRNTVVYCLNLYKGVIILTSIVVENKYTLFNLINLL